MLIKTREKLNVTGTAINVICCYHDYQYPFLCTQAHNSNDHHAIWEI